MATIRTMYTNTIEEKNKGLNNNYIVYYYDSRDYNVPCYVASFKDYNDAKKFVDNYDGKIKFEWVKNHFNYYILEKLYIIKKENIERFKEY